MLRNAPPAPAQGIRLACEEGPTFAGPLQAMRLTTPFQAPARAPLAGGPGLLAGAAAGTLGVWVLDRIDWFLFRREPASSRERTRRIRPGGEPPSHVLAGLAERALGLRSSPMRHEALGTAIHYAIGVVPAAFYGALRGRYPGLTAGRGTAFGLGGFVLLDEIANAASGLAAPLHKYPWQAHARSLVAHAAYGLVTETALRAIDRRMARRS